MNKTNLPGFLAEATLYPTSGGYFGGKNSTNTALANQLLPAALNLGYNCDSESGHCRCNGLFDCLDMVIFGHVCGDILVCGARGCACDWRRF